jgi:AraC family cel operon transcriptional repressor
MLHLLGQAHGRFSLKPPSPVRIKAFLTFIIDSWVKGSSTGEKAIPGWLERTMRSMEHQSFYKDGLDLMITISGKTQEHLTRTMRKATGLTPTAFINGLRLEEAKRLLQTTDKDILDIVEESGFHNVSHFMNLFKSRFGTTPLRYRKLAKKIFGQ